MESRNTVSVLLPIPTEAPYSYGVPHGLDLQPGDFVQVPLGSREVAAVVWDKIEDTVDPKKLRNVISKFDCPPLTASMRRFIEWISGYTLSPPGMVLKMVLRVPAALPYIFTALKISATASIVGAIDRDIAAITTRGIQLINARQQVCQRGLPAA